MQLWLVLVLAASPEWKEVAADGFTASLPGAPKVEDGEVPTEAGTLKSRTWALETGSFYYAIAQVAYPPELVKKSVPAKMLEGARDGALANIQATLEKDAAVTLGDGKKKWPGREFSGSTPTGLHYAARIYLVDAVLYQVISVRPVKEGDDEAFKKIVASFKLKAPAKKK